MLMRERQGRGYSDEGMGIMESGASLSWEEENFPAGKLALGPLGLACEHPLVEHRGLYEAGYTQSCSSAAQ